jgi:hypothetical protein
MMAHGLHNATHQPEHIMYYECRNGSIIEIRNINTGEVKVLFASKGTGIKHGAVITLFALRIEAMNGTILKGGLYGSGFDVIGKAPAKLINAATKISYVIWYGGIAVCIMLGGWIAFKLFS